MAKLVYTDPSGRELNVPLGPDSPVVSIGRATDCTIRSNRKSVSRHHAEFRYNNGRYEVVDLNSSNGTYLIIDDKRQPVTDAQPLAHRDEVWCGDFILRFFEDGADSAPIMELEPDYGQNMGGGVQGNFSQRPPSGRQQPVSGGVSAGGPAQQGGPPPPQSGGAQAARGGYDDFGQLGSPVNPTPAPSDDHGGVSMGRGAAPPPPTGGHPPVAGGVDDPGRDSAELQRLRDEKQSIQELADRQSREVEQLRAELEELRDRVHDAEDNADHYRREAEQLREDLAEARSAADHSSQIEELERELDFARQQRQDAQKEMELLRQSSQDAEEERRRAEERLQEATKKIDDLRLSLEEAGAKDAEVARLEDELAEQHQTIDSLRRRLERAAEELVAAKNDTSRDEINQMREEIGRQERLLEEYEKRNRDLQQQCDRERSARTALENIKSDYEDRLNVLQARHDELEQEAGELRGALESARSQNEDNLRVCEKLQKECDESRSEVEGLKQRLRLAKKRAKEVGADTDVEELQQRIEELQEKLEVAEASASASPAVNGSVAVDELAEHARTLDRVVDAIERLDLTPLSTVDRVRLQSAIREAKPRQTLSAMLKLVQQDADA